MSATDTFGSTDIGDDDVDGAQHDRDVEEDALAQLADVCLIDSGSVDATGATIWTCDNCGAEGAEDVMDEHVCPGDSD